MRDTRHNTDDEFIHPAHDRFVVPAVGVTEIPPYVVDLCTKMLRYSITECRLTQHIKISEIIIALETFFDREVIELVWDRLLGGGVDYET